MLLDARRYSLIRSAIVDAGRANGIDGVDPESISSDVARKYKDQVRLMYGDRGDGVLFNHDGGVAEFHRPSNLNRLSKPLNGVWRLFFYRMDKDGNHFFGTILALLYNNGPNEKKAVGLSVGRGEVLWDIECEIVFDRMSWTWYERGGDGKYFMMVCQPDSEVFPKTVGIFSRVNRPVKEFPNDPRAVVAATVLGIKCDLNRCLDILPTGISEPTEEEKSHVISVIRKVLDGGAIDRSECDLIVKYCAFARLSVDELVASYPEFVDYLQGIVSRGEVVTFVDGISAILSHSQSVSLETRSGG